MLFPTVEFFIFFYIVFFGSWMLKNNIKNRNTFLALASLFFYGFWDYKFVFLLLFGCVSNYYFSQGILNTGSQKLKKLYLILSLIVSLGILGFFKYYTFAVINLQNTLSYFSIQVDLPFLNIVLPVGISFFTFQIMSYTIDVYRGKITERYSLGDVILYISFFPQLVAGPIVRAEEFLPQLKNKADSSAIPALRAFNLIGTGLFKKILIANYLATELVDPAFENPGAFSSLELVIAAYGYAIQIYCDFSAYSDIAIGVALLLGFHFPDNFNSPYKATSLQDFWRRWHISLSSWLRDYLYISLGGSKEGKWKTYRNLLLTMLLGGLWHGASWSFFIWGGMHGLMLAVERFFGEFKFKWKIPSFIGWIFTFHFVIFCWIFFRAGNLENSLTYLDMIYSNVYKEDHILTPFIIGILLLGFISHYIPDRVSFTMETILSKFHPLVQGLVFSVILILLGAISPQGVMPFIYFQF